MSDKKPFQAPQLLMGISSLKYIKDPDLRSHLRDEIDPLNTEKAFSKNWIKVGYVKETVDGNVIRIPFRISTKETWRSIVFGMTRSAGKSMLLRRMMDEAWYTRFAICFMTDVKDEMKSSINPQRKFIRHLMKDDMPTGLPIAIYRPRFYIEIDKQQTGIEKIPDYNQPFSIAYNKLKFDELQAAMNFNKKDKQEHSNVLSLYWNMAKTLGELKNLIEIDSAIRKGVKKDLILAIDVLIKYKVFTDFQEGDFINDMVNFRPVVFNHYGYKTIGTSDLPTFPQIYVKICSRFISEARKSGVLKNKVFLIFDEAPAFVQDDTLSGKEIHRIVNEEGYLGIFILFAVQTIENIPPWVLQQCRYMFAPHNINVETAKEILKYAQMYDFHPNWTKKLTKFIKKMGYDDRTGAREWMIVDTVKKTKETFWGLPSLSEHMETKA